MEIMKIHVTGSTACVLSRQPLVAGTVGMPVEFTFGEDWQALKKTAVFCCDGITCTVLNLESRAVIPWELLKKPNCLVKAGVYGTNEDGSVQTPTLWAELGKVQPGADPTGDESADPSLPVWEQVYQKVDEAVKESLSDAKASGEFQGEKGAPGYTPQKGTDYYTDADKKEMVQAVLAALPDGDEVSY